MKDSYALDFREAVSDTLEQFAFTFLDVEEDACFNAMTNDYIYVEMGFSGPVDGTVSLCASVDFCNHLAANVLGDDSDAVDMAMSEDVLKEFLNVMCGQLTCSLFGDPHVFNLTVPSVQHIDQNKWHELLASFGTIRFWVEGHPLLGRLMIAGGLV